MSDYTGSMRTRLWRAGRLEADNYPSELISDHLETDDCLVWVDICDPGHQDLLTLAEALGLHPAAVEATLAHGERAKATRYTTHTFLTAYSTAVRSETAAAAHDVETMGICRVSAFVFTRGTVTVRTGDGFDIEAVVRRWEDNNDLLQSGVGALVYGLLDVVVDTHFKAVQALDDKIEGLEDGLFDDKAVSKEIQRRAYQVRKDLVELRRVVLPMRELVNAVLRHRKDFQAPSELDPWFDDLYDHVMRASEWTESLRDMLSAIFETNLSLKGHPHEHSHEAAHSMGRHNRSTHRSHRILRPKRSLFGLRATPRSLPKRRHHRRRRRIALPIQTTWMALALTAWRRRAPRRFFAGARPQTGHGRH